MKYSLIINELIFYKSFIIWVQNDRKIIKKRTKAAPKRTNSIWGAKNKSIPGNKRCNIKSKYDDMISWSTT